MWSNAWNGTRPKLFFTFVKAVWYLIANLFIFLPKRKILIEILDQTSTLKELSQGDLVSFNQYLEDFYNQRGRRSIISHTTSISTMSITKSCLLPLPILLLLCKILVPMMLPSSQLISLILSPQNSKRSKI